MGSRNAVMRGVNEMQQRDERESPREATTVLLEITGVASVPTLSSVRPKTRPCPAWHFARTSARANSLLYPS